MRSSTDTTTISRTATEPDAGAYESTSSARPRARARLVDQPAERLEAEVIDLAGRLAAGTYELLVLVGELDHRGSWATWGSLTCAAWLADTCDIEISTARTQVRVARAMRQFPALDAAMASGDVSYAKARVLASCLTDTNVDDLLAIAETTPAGKLGAAIAAWSRCNEDPDAIRRRQHDARGISWRTEPDGLVLATLRLTPKTPEPSAPPSTPRSPAPPRPRARPSPNNAPTPSSPSSPAAAGTSPPSWSSTPPPTAPP
jgi:hypothetical protein